MKCDDLNHIEYTHVQRHDKWLLSAICSVVEMQHTFSIHLEWQITCTSINNEWQLR